MMKKLWILIFILPMLSFSKDFKNTEKKFQRKPQQILDFNSKCSTQLTLLFESMKSLNKWQKQAPAKTGADVFRSPTAEFGHWLEIVIEAEGSPTLFSIKKDVVQVYQFDSVCKKTITAKAGMDFSLRTTDKMKSTWFDDRALKNLMLKSNAGLIYVWSPEMTYSAKYYKYFRDVAKKLKLTFISVLDPRCQVLDVERAIKDYGLPPTDAKLNSVELYMRNLTVHYPTTLVYKNGILSDLPVVGVMSEEDLELAVQRALVDLIAQTNN